MRGHFSYKSRQLRAPPGGRPAPASRREAGLAPRAAGRPAWPPRAAWLRALPGSARRREALAPCAAGRPARPSRAAGSPAWPCAPPGCRLRPT